MAQYIETATDLNVEGVEFFVKDNDSYLYDDAEYTKKSNAENIKHEFEMNDVVIIDNNIKYRPVSLAMNEGIAYLNYVKSTVVEGVITPSIASIRTNPVFDLKNANRLDVSGATPGDNPGIAQNGDKYTVTKNSNKIVVKGNGLIPYVGGNKPDPKKWVGILVDLGVKAIGTKYTIEDADYTDAARWGAENNTTFIMWLTTEQGGVYKFVNAENSDETIELVVEFE